MIFFLLQGKFKYASGAEYQGNWVMGVQSGKGKLSLLLGIIPL